MGDLDHDGFGHWLAGLIDGEGCFQITPNRPGFAFRLIVGLRDDDLPIIEAIHARLGLGTVYAHQRPSDTSARRPLALWRVGRIGECVELIDILDRYPLRTKKARDYAIWKEGVRAAIAMPPPNGRPRDWSAVAAIKERLHDGRIHPSLRQPRVAAAALPRAGA